MDKFDAPSPRAVLALDLAMALIIAPLAAIVGYGLFF